MTQQQWEALGFAIEMFGPFFGGYVLTLSNGKQIVVTDADEEQPLPIDGGSLRIGLYNPPSIEDGNCFAYVDIGSNFKDTKLEPRFVEAVIWGLITEMEK